MSGPRKAVASLRSTTRLVLGCCAVFSAYEQGRRNLIVDPSDWQLEDGRGLDRSTGLRQVTRDRAAVRADPGRPRVEGDSQFLAAGNEHESRLADGPNTAPVRRRVGRLQEIDAFHEDV